MNMTGEGADKPRLDVSRAFKDGQFLRVNTQWTRQQGYYPNELWHSERDRVTLIVAKASSDRGEDFSLNAKALYDMLDAVRSGRIAAAYVVFVERRDLTLVPFGHKHVDEMIERLKVEPIEGKHGRFWWID